MADPKVPKEKAEKAPPKEKKPKPDKGILETTAEAIGAAIGTIAATTGLAHPAAAEPKPPKKSGKLVKKNKARLPRKEKKKAQKAKTA